MSLRVETVVLEPNMLLRAGLTSLVEKYSYRVIASAAAASDLSDERLSERPRLVVLGAATIDDAIAQGAICRRRWPKCKIMLLYDHADPEEARKISTSEVDGCMPVSVSPETLARGLDLLVGGEDMIKIMLVPSPRQPNPSQAAPLAGEAIKNTAVSSNHLGRASANDGSFFPTIPEAVAPSSVAARDFPKLSEREKQILDGIVHGYQNKMIARMCGITETTVKVHMRSILRKIQVANRTQAAVWAVEHNLALDEVKTRLLESAEIEEGK